MADENHTDRSRNVNRPTPDELRRAAERIGEAIGDSLAPVAQHLAQVLYPLCEPDAVALINAHPDADTLSIAEAARWLRDVYADRLRALDRLARKAKGGRPRDPLLDEAWAKIRDGARQAEVFNEWLRQARIAGDGVNRTTEYKRFKRAMQYRRGRR